MRPTGWPRGARPVDYRRVAAVYGQGRALSDVDLGAWRTVVLRAVPPPLGSVLDLGAGTGIFARAWRAWGARSVVACEPAPAMRAEAAAHGRRHGVAVAAGHAERIPLCDSSVDAVWLSTVVHHLADRHAAASEILRVLRPGGRLLVRNLLADAGTTSWLAELPGAERARRIFPTSSELAALLCSVGLEPVETVEVLERHRDRTAGAAAAWIRRMRHADSLLLAFRDEEIAAGLGRLEAYPAGYVLEPSRIPLVVFQSPG